MFSRLFGRAQSGNVPEALYGGLVEQSRLPEFFSDIGVPDTVMGRFDMLAMHTYLLARRLREENEDRAISLSQEVFDLFVSDIERALRELGIGDTTVPKRKKRMVKSFYGQIEDFDQPLAEKDMETLCKRTSTRYGADVEGFDAVRLTDYMIRCASHLGNNAYKDILRGQLTWPEL